MVLRLRSKTTTTPPKSPGNSPIVGPVYLSSSPNVLICSKGTRLACAYLVYLALLFLFLRKGVSEGREPVHRALQENLHLVAVPSEA